MYKQALTVACDGGSDRQLGGGQLQGKRVFFADLRIAPACRTVELEHPQFAVIVAQLVDAILVAVQSEQAAGRSEANALRGREYGTRIKRVEGRGC
jgi:hypothetical protein